MKAAKLTLVMADFEDEVEKALDYITQKQTERLEKNNNTDQVLHWEDTMVEDSWYDFMLEEVEEGQYILINFMSGCKSDAWEI